MSLREIDQEGCLFVERTLVLVKPDGVQRRLAGSILARFESKGLRLAAMKLLRVTRAQAENLYSVHAGKPFYSGLVDFITSGPIVATCWEGPRVIAIARKLLGKTFGHEAEPGTIRGDFGSSQGFNLVHGSDSPDSAKRELAIFFGAGEFCDYTLPDESWIVNPREDK